MKHLINYSIILIVILAFSCNKDLSKREKLSRDYTGYIYNLADSTPHKNTSFKFYYFIQESLLSGSGIYEDIKVATTDSNGFFDVNFNIIRRVSGPGRIFICHPDVDNSSCMNSTAAFGTGKIGGVDTFYTY